MSKFDKPVPTDRQILLDTNRIIMSKTDLKGVIEYANDYFVEICGYSKAELMGEPHNIIRHPDMPKAVFKLLWDTIKAGKNIFAIVKNFAKNGDYYWVIARVEPKFDASGNIESYFSQRKAVSQEAISRIEPYYKDLLEIESLNKVEISEKYFKGLLEELNLTYDDFLLKMLGMTQPELNKYFEEAKVINPLNTEEKKSKRPVANDKETKMDPTKTIMSKTDLKGIIQYSNDYFVEICEYSKEELMGKPHNIIRHPDMPKLVFKIMWDRLKRGEGLYAIVKNLTKSGGFYWVIARIDPKYNENGEMDSYFSYRKAVPVKAIRKIEQYYKMLLNMEKNQKPEVAENYFKGLLEEKNLTYDEFVLRILETDEKTLNTYFNEVNSIKVHAEVSDNYKRSAKPVPQNKEISVDPSRVIMSKTNAKGIIEYANDYFIEISGYEQHELMGRAHNIVRHPDMPKSIFKFLWDTIQKGENIHALVKNLAKDGRYYWVITNFETKYDDNGAIESYYSKRKAAPKEAVYEIEKLYNTLNSIERNQGMQVALNFFLGMLEEKGITYNQYVTEILGISEEELEQYFQESPEESSPENKKRGFLSRMFSK